MKTILVIAPQPGLADAVRAVLDPQLFRVLHQKQVWEAELFLTSAGIDLTILEADLTNIQPIRTIELLRRRMPDCPIIVFAGERQTEWEEEAYLRGVSHVLHKPVRARLLNMHIEKLLALETEKAPA